MSPQPPPPCNHPLIPKPRTTLLSLPRELRDIIYAHVLTHPHGLLARPAAYPSPHTHLHPLHQTSYLRLPANQLQFVNRQLHHETRGLSLLHNTLTFADTWRYDTGSLSAFTHFERFTGTCARPWLERLRRIEVRDKHGFAACWASEAVRYAALLRKALVPFCEDYPRAVVVVRLAWGDGVLAEEYVECVEALAGVLRGGSLLEGVRCVEKRGEGQRRSNSNKATELARRFAFRCPENLRFSCTTRFEEVWARRGLSRCLEGELVEWGVEMFRRMHEKGV